MPTNAVTIDAAWITAAGDAPYMLDAPNTVYTLAVDVNVVQAGFNGQPFRLVGDEILLVPDGHTIRVDGKPVPQVKDSMLYGNTSEYAVRADPSKDSYMYGGTYGTGVGAVGGTADIVPPADRPLINPWARTK